jgi:peptide/nickel transport system substrate-binding protein
MAQALKETAAAGGFNIKLNILPSADYWNVWAEVPLGITIWVTRPLGTMVLQLGYTADETGKPAPWNESHWVDQEFNDLLRQATKTLDVEKRRAIMCQIEDIQMTRGTAGIAFWTNGWNIFNKKFKNISAHPTAWQFMHDVWYDPEG